MAKRKLNPNPWRNHMVVRLKAFGKEPVQLGMIMSCGRTTAVVVLDARCYRASGNDDGLREVEYSQLEPVKIRKA